MRFRFTDEQRMLQESAERFLLEHSPPAVARAAATAPAGLDLPLWQQVTSTLGWQALAVPEEQDGLGLGVVELAVLLEQAGTRLSPIPFTLRQYRRSRSERRLTPPRGITFCNRSLLVRLCRWLTPARGPTGMTEAST